VIAALLALALSAPDAGTDAPWKEERDGGTIVCMSEPFAVALARGGVATEVTQKKEEAALLKSDPEPLKVVLFTAGGFVVGASVAAAVVCAVVKDHCGLAPSGPAGK